MRQFLSMIAGILISFLFLTSALAFDFRGRDIQVPDSLIQRYPTSVQAARSTLGAPTNGPIRLHFEPQVASNAGGDPVTAGEAFVINAASDGGIDVFLASSRAAPVALATIERTVLEDSSFVEAGRIIRPALRSRGAHFMIRSLDEAEIIRVLDIIRRSRFNLLILNIGEGVRWDLLPEKAYLPKAVSKEAIRRVIDYARGFGVEIVVSAKLLSHQEKLLKKTRPDLLWNSTTMDPTNPATMEFQKGLIDEIIETTGARRFNIAHDEVAGFRRKVKRGETMLPPSLFYQNIRDLTAHNASRGVETWMWADMLLIPEDFPSMRQGHLHARRHYKTAAKVETLPPEIVMMSWHYRDEAIEYPALSHFVDKGHRVFGATWRFEPALRNMTNYVANVDRRIEGMIATHFYSPTNRFNTVAALFRTAGDTYWDGGFKEWKTDSTARMVNFTTNPKVRGGDPLQRRCRITKDC